MDHADLWQSLVGNDGRSEFYKLLAKLRRMDISLSTSMVVM